MKVKVKRKADDGNEQELEVEEAEVLETDTRVEPAQAPGTKPPDKQLPQSEVNKLMADERRKHKAELDALKSEYTDFKKTVEDREAAANEAAKAKVEKLIKDLPDPIVALLEKLSPTEQLEWLSDPANTITKKQIPDLPEPRSDAERARKVQVII